MVGHGGRPAHRAEQDGVHAADLRFPVVGHHLAVLGEVVAAGPFDRRQRQLQAETLGGGGEYALTFGHHFLADAVTGDQGDALGGWAHVGSRWMAGKVGIRMLDHLRRTAAGRFIAAWPGVSGTTLILIKLRRRAAV